MLKHFVLNISINNGFHLIDSQFISHVVPCDPIRKMSMKYVGLVTREQVKGWVLQLNIS